MRLNKRHEKLLQMWFQAQLWIETFEIGHLYVFGNRRNELQIVHFDVNNFFNIEKYKKKKKDQLCLFKYSNKTKLFYKIME